MSAPATSRFFDFTRGSAPAGSYHRNADRAVHHGTKQHTSGMYGDNDTVRAIVIFLAVCIALYVFRPDWVLKTDEADSSRKVFDWGKMLLWSLILSLGVLAFTYFLQMRK